ncbi:hypothetical protein K2F54_15125 [Cryobacterium sp. 1639]|uniref:hypothetical protein n=1 Tax=Cryobacterium inferilacus TaxID=2866629 RepID=UPI001C7372AF|nr:hypothetical protein [Cryobacterium sp. 1639]MBX0301304.1 hypothetical protein [Cryobacterium sp. 1639]
MTSGVQANTRFRILLPAVVIVVVTWLIFWMAQGFSTICILMGPCPGRDVRVAPALLFGGIMLAPMTAVILTSLVRSPIGWLVRLSYVLLVGLAVAGYAVVNFVGGFGVDAPFLAGFIGICGTTVLAYLGIAGLRREASAA